MLGQPVADGRGGVVLADVIICTQGNGFRYDLRVGIAREHDHWQRCMSLALANLCQHIQTGDAGHVDVENQQIWRFLFER